MKGLTGTPKPKGLGEDSFGSFRVGTGLASLRPADSEYSYENYLVIIYVIF